MHAVDMLKYGHSFFMEALDGVDEPHTDDPGVCGEWSVKDIIAHLASMEWILVEVLEWVLDHDTEIPQIMTYGKMGPAQFNTTAVEERKDKDFSEVLKEYETAYAKTVDLLAQIPQETQRQSGLLAWYGPDYDLEDLIVYTYYAHKREHGAQVSVFKDRIKSEV